MIVPFHNWKDKLKNLIREYPKTTTGVLVVVLSVLVFVAWAQAVNAWDPLEALKDAGKTVLASLISIVTMILYYVLVVPLFWLIAVVIQVMVEVASWQLFINEPAVVAGWTIARDLVNVGFIAVLLYIAFGTVISYKSVNWQKDLVKLITAVVLVNFSRMIVGLLIDISQVIMLTFVNGFRNIAGGNITGNLGLDWYLSSASTFSTDLDKASGNFVKLAIGIAMGVLLLSILAMLTAWLLLRIVKLWILTVMSPFYFLADFFPFLKSFHSYWEKELTDNLVAGPFMAFGIWFAMSVISQTGQPSAITTPRGVLADAQALATTVTDGTVAKQSNAIFTMIIGAGLLYGVYDMSKKMAGTAGKVGMDVLNKGKNILKSGAMTVGKYADMGVARLSKDYLHHDLSVGGMRDYFREKSAAWGAKVEAFKAKGDENLKEYREKKLDEKAKANLDWKHSEEERKKANAEKEDLNEKIKEREKEIKEGERQVSLGENIRDRLLKQQERGEDADVRRKKIDEAMEKAKSGDFGALKALMADPSYNLSADLKDKVAKYEEGRDKLSQRKGAIDNLYTKASASGGIIEKSHLSGLVSSGVLTSDEAASLEGKSIHFIDSTNPEIAKKFKDYQDLSDGISSGQGIDISKARAVGLDVDDGSDIFSSLQVALDQESKLVDDGVMAKSALQKWQSGTLSAQDADFLGLSGEEKNLVMGRSFASLKEELEKKREEQNAAKDKLKGLDSIIANAEKKMKAVKRNLKENYLKSTSTRVIEARYKKGRDALLQDMERRFPNHDTPEDLAEIYSNVNDPEAREFAINKLQKEDVQEFMKDVGCTPDIYGIYDFALRLGSPDGKIDENIQQLLNKARDEGSNLDEKSETELMEALNDSISDPYAKEIFQKFLKKVRPVIPSAKHVLSVDQLTGNVAFTPSKTRRKKDFDAIQRGEISATGYDGYAHETSSGGVVLDDVGFNQFKKHFGQINKYTMHTYDQHFIQALVANKEEILQRIGENDPNYNKMKKVLDEIENLTYSNTREEDYFEEFKSHKP